MAAPHVAGALALIFGEDPTLTVDAATSTMMASASVGMSKEEGIAYGLIPPGFLGCACAM